MELNDFFSQLDVELRAEGMTYGPDVWLRVYQLVERLKQKGPLPEDKRKLMPLMRPLFCRNPEEQARFAFLFEQCLTKEPQSLSAVNRIASPQQAAIAGTLKKARKIERYWWWGGILVLLTIILVIFFFVYEKPAPKELPRPPKVTDKITIKSDGSPNESSVDQSTVTIVDHIPPRPQPEPGPGTTEKAPWYVLLYGLPWLIAVWWFGKLYSKKLALTREPHSGDNLFNQLQFQKTFTPIWGGADAESSLRDLRSARFIPTRRLDVAATVKATARNGDYFQPIYRTRRIPPEHLLLVRSLNRNDQQAGLAEELAKRFKALDLEVKIYHFRDDPRWLAHWDDKGGSDYIQLEQILARHGAARLLVISETDILFHPYSGEARSWLAELSPWQDKIWLHPFDALKPHAKLLTEHDFLMLPLSRDSFPKLVNHLTAAQPARLTVLDTKAIELPDIITAEPDGWLGEQPPYGVNLADLEWQLENFLGTYGLRLLRAIAVYPKPNWQLTMALDYLLFGKLEQADPPARREQRLSRLSRLPWLMHGFLPNWLRDHLLVNSDPDERQRVVEVWQSLFSQLTDQGRPDSLQLNFSTPSKRQIKLRLNERRALPQSDAINDPIFANILMGGQFGLLDFQLPRALAKRLPYAQRVMDLRPILGAAAGAMLGMAAIYGINKIVIDPPLDTARWKVTVQYQPDTQQLANTLQQRLQQLDFQVAQPIESADSEKAVFVVTNGGPVLTEVGIQSTNTITYSLGGKKAAEIIRSSLAWLTYGADIDWVESAKLPTASIFVQLVKTYQHGAGFNDELRASQESRLPFEPEMVAIPPGKFLMGSPKTEAGRSSDEDPQHEVTIGYSFEISKYEVTFDEYDAFAKATKRKLPDDRGWGRGNRPVINVSFIDAQAYVKWLSDQTGKKYRLPTEAEWEYAARAGTQTTYWWGNDIGKNNANCRGCGSEWDGKQTAPEDSFKPNTFGLHNTAGNVYEWVEDCMHGNYQGAPVDGSAWKEANGGDCDRRVVRGGSWDYNPQNLRSAIRNRYFTGGAVNNLGFRIARAF